jgi:hypothetical protein
MECFLVSDKPEKPEKTAVFRTKNTDSTPASRTADRLDALCVEIAECDAEELLMSILVALSHLKLGLETTEKVYKKKPLAELKSLMTSSLLGTFQVLDVFDFFLTYERTIKKAKKRKHDPILKPGSGDEQS